MRQWHIVGPVDVAKDLVESCCAWSGATFEAVLVFDRGGWRPDTKLWKAVQTVSFVGGLACAARQG